MNPSFWPRVRPAALRTAAACLALALAHSAQAQGTNTLVWHSDLPDVGASAVRALGALALVLALFFGGIWLFRNGQRIGWGKGGAPRLAILESRSLGGRYSLHVVGYNQQRLLVGSSPAGLSLLSQLPSEPDAPPKPAPAAEPWSFAQHMQQLLKGTPAPTGSSHS